MPSGIPEHGVVTLPPGMLLRGRRRCRGHRPARREAITGRIHAFARTAKRSFIDRNDWEAGMIAAAVAITRATSRAMAAGGEG